jgi:hypothetical protein
MVASFHDLAKVELNEAAQFYEAESPGLGAAFLAEAERSVAFLLAYPESGLLVRGSVRRCLCGDFPSGCCIAFVAIGSEFSR